MIQTNEVFDRIPIVLSPFQQDFLEPLSVPELQRLLLAALYLDIRDLYILAAQRSANLMVNKTPEQVRQEWGLEDDLTEEDKQNIRTEHVWVVAEKGKGQ